MNSGVVQKCNVGAQALKISMYITVQVQSFDSHALSPS
jgi:hypothetical protein